MRLLVVIGAGMSYDSWTSYSQQLDSVKRLPLAKDLFSSLPIQNKFLNDYKLMGIASTLRQHSKVKNQQFDIESELANLKALAEKQKDNNILQELFVTRFYIQSVIEELNKYTVENTHSHTIYVDLLNKLKSWIDYSPNNRIVDIVVFNYDTLIEKAMEHVYPYDWRLKNQSLPLDAYIKGVNLKIYKPHGSINWGREIQTSANIIAEDFQYNNIDQVFENFDKVILQDKFKIIDPNAFTNVNTQKNFIPAIAVPFKGKVNFEECPPRMQEVMKNAITEADKILTIGWKAGDEHFTSLLKGNKKIKETIIVSTNSTSNLSQIVPISSIKFLNYSASAFVSESQMLDNILEGLDKK